jgi:arsenical-resistance protein 2
VLLELRYFHVRMLSPDYLGSSLHRGSRAAGWFDDLIKDQANTNMKSLVLVEGINGWASAGEDYERHMDGFVPRIWKK